MECLQKLNWSIIKPHPNEIYTLLNITILHAYKLSSNKFWIIFYIVEIYSPWSSEDLTTSPSMDSMSKM